MDLLSDSILTRNRDWKVYSNTPQRPPSIIKDNAKISNSIIAEGCTIDGEIYNSVIFGNVNVSKKAVIKNSVIFSDSYIGSNAKIINCLMDEGGKISRNCHIGDKDYLTVIKRNSKIHTSLITDKKIDVSWQYHLFNI